MTPNEKQKDFLLHTALFESCGLPRYYPLLDRVIVQRYDKGQCLTDTPHFPHSLLCVLSGYITAYNLNSIPLDTLGAGSFFNGNLLFQPDDTPMYCNVYAHSSCCVAYFERDLLFPLLKNDSQLAMNYMNILSRLIHHLMIRINSFTAPSPAGRIALYLLDFCPGDELSLQDGYTGLAHALDISRATLYRSLAQMEKAALIARFEKRLLILNRYGLEQLAGLHD
ncbi:MAG: Crp/Fnr family transcriptional regulator [Butyricicoccaceae bacterium]